MLPTPSTSSIAEMQSVSPALARYASETIVDALWTRTSLSPRDRMMVTLAILIAANQPAELKHYVALSLNEALTPAEVSEIITHLAFYAGWPNAMAAIKVTQDVFRDHGITPDQLPPASPTLMPLNQEAEQQRAESVAQHAGWISPALVKFTADPLFLEVWQRPALAPRDRSLITVSALIACGQNAQVTWHLNRAMDNGLTADDMGEVIAHTAFYAGWPRAFSAIPVVGEVFRQRASAVGD